MTRSLLIVGSGLAAVSAVEALRARGYDGRVTMFSAEARLPYDRPPLSKDVLLGEAPEGVPLRPESFYDDHGVDLRLGEEITALEPERRQVTDLQGRVARADGILLAMGGTARELPIPGAELDGVCVLRGLDDALDLEARLEPGARLIVVGGGFVGTEVAAAARTRGLEVTIVEAMPALLARALPVLAPHVVDHHRAQGVTVRAGSGVEAFTGRRRVEGVRLAGGEVLPADLVVVGIGMRPRDELAVGAGLEVSDGIHVDERGQTSVPGVHAIGDVASRPDGQGGRRRTEHWQSAVDDGRRAAVVLTGGDPGPPPVPWFWSDQFDLNIQVAGHPAPHHAQLLRGDPSTGRATVVFHVDGVPTAVATLNNGREVRPLTTLIATGVRVDLPTLADPSNDVRKLARTWVRDGIEATVER